MLIKTAAALLETGLKKIFVEWANGSSVYALIQDPAFQEVREYLEANDHFLYYKNDSLLQRDIQKAVLSIGSAISVKTRITVLYRLLKYKRDLKTNTQKELLTIIQSQPSESQQIQKDLDEAFKNCGGGGAAYLHFVPQVYAAGGGGNFGSKCLTALVSIGKRAPLKVFSAWITKPLGQPTSVQPASQPLQSQTDLNSTSPTFRRR